MKYLNTFIKAKNLDKRMVMDYLGGEDPRRTYPLYHSSLVPTFAGSLDIFELKQLKKIKVETIHLWFPHFLALWTSLNSSSWRRSR